MISFKYVQIEDDLLTSLEQSLLHGHSVILIGSRYAGKRTMFQLLSGRLGRSELPHALVDLSACSIVSEDSLCNQLLNSVKQSISLPIQNGASKLDLVMEQIGRHTILLFSNIDALPQALAHRFLRTLESRIEERQTIAIITGETDLRQILGGAKTDLNIAEHFFVQGFANRVFAQELSQYLKQLLIRLTPNTDSVNFLHESCGGNIYLAKLVLKEGIIEQEIANQRQGKPRIVSISKDLLATATENIAGTAASFTGVLANVVQYIWQEPDCISRLEELLDVGRIAPDDDSDSPTSLELAGIAVRRRETMGLQEPFLQFASPIVKEFVRNYLNDIRRGDLYVRKGDWDRAVDRYKMTSEELRIRPRSRNDRVAVEGVIRSVCVMLHMRATEKDRGSSSMVNGVDRLFSEACQYVLGFHEVTMLRWKRGVTGKGSWQCDDDNSRVPVAKLLDSLRSASSLPSVGTYGPDPQYAHCVRVIVGESNPTERTVVALSDFERGTIISSVRSGLLKQLIPHYIRAREHAVAAETADRRVQMMKQYRLINEFISSRVQAQKLPVAQVLDFIAKELRPLGYSTIGIGYLSRPLSKVICGVYWNSEYDEPMHDKWPSPQLAQANFDAAIAQTPREVTTGAGSFWIIPLRAPEGESNSSAEGSNQFRRVTHTFVVQREDGNSLTEAELEDLASFGDQMMTALEQGERLLLMQSAVESIEEPLAIVDSEERVRLANKAMRNLFSGAPDGWQYYQKAPIWDEVFSGTGSSIVLDALRGLAWKTESNETQSKIVQIRVGETLISDDQAADTGVGQTRDHRILYGRIHSKLIRNTRGRPIGASTHIQDFGDHLATYHVMRTLFTAQTEEVIVALLLNIARRPDQWRRFYRLDSQNVDLLVGAAAMGPANMCHDDFNSGQITIPRDPRTRSSWLCFERNKPVLLKCGSVGENTLYGLPVEMVKNPPRTGVLQKKDGDMWLDVPLKGCGKLSMECDNEIKPEEIEFWKNLGEGAAFALENLRRQNTNRKNAILASERTLLAGIAHNLHTRIAGLSAIEAQYEWHEKQNPSESLHAINIQLARFTDMVFPLTQRVRGHLGMMQVIPAEFDLIASLNAVLGQGKVLEQSSISSTSDFRIFADKQLIEGMFAEFIQNSRDAADASRTLQIRLEVERFQVAGEEWVRIVYQDNGRGVTPEVKQRIFELFYTHRTNGTQGTGMGLYFVQRVALAHGGSVVESGVPGEGARFVVEIPKRFSLAKER